jgi:pilus assembly protein CpaE
MKPTIVFIGEENLALTSLCQQLQEEAKFTVENEIFAFDQAFEYLRTKSGPVLSVMDLSQDSEKAFQVAEDIKLNLPDIHLLMTSSKNGSETILRAMRAGAEEFFTQPFNWPEVFESLERVREKIDLRSARNVNKGRIIAVYSNKGGVGSTTVTTNLAVALAAQKEYSVCVVDLMLEFGSVTSFLNLEASYTIVDFVKNLERIDPLFLDGSLIEHSSGVRVLAEPSRVEDASRIEASDIEQILNILVQSFDIVIVDSPKDFAKPGFFALEMANLILFVTTMDVPSLKGAHRALELFDRMKMDPSKVQLIVNRYFKSKLLGLESVEKALGIKAFWTLPEDYPTAMGALNQGLSILEENPKSAAAKSYQGLAHEVVKTLSFSGPKPEENGKKRGILTRWLPDRSASQGAT